MDDAQWENWLELVLSFWLFLAPWLIASHNEIPTLALLNVWVVAAIVAASASLALQELRPWEEWVNTVAGVWLLASPWVLGYTEDRGLVWNSVVVGVLIAGISVIAIPAAKRRRG
jgi:hypothetical protein